MKTTEDYYLEQSNKAGSSLYYSVLFLPSELKNASVLLASFWKTLSTILIECSDVGIARQKAYWWHDELAKLGTGKCSHPLAISIEKLVLQYHLDPKLFLNVCQAVIYRLDHPVFFNLEELMTYCQQSMGQLMQIESSILGFTDNKTLTAVRELGVATQLIYLLQNFRQDLAHGYSFLPEELMKKHKVDQTKMSRYEMTSELDAALQDIATLSRDRFRKALHDFPHVDYKVQKPIIILAKLKQLLLTEIEQAHFPILTQKISLTPLRKLWNAVRG